MLVSPLTSVIVPVIAFPGTGTVEVHLHEEVDALAKIKAFRIEANPTERYVFGAGGRGRGREKGRKRRSGGQEHNRRAGGSGAWRVEEERAAVRGG